MGCYVMRVAVRSGGVRELGMCGHSLHGNRETSGRTLDGNRKKQGQAMSCPDGVGGCAKYLVYGCGKSEEGNVKENVEFYKCMKPDKGLQCIVSDCGKLWGLGGRVKCKYKCKRLGTFFGIGGVDFIGDHKEKGRYWGAWILIEGSEEVVRSPRAGIAQKCDCPTVPAKRWEY